MLSIYLLVQVTFIYKQVTRSYFTLQDESSRAFPAISFRLSLKPLIYVCLCGCLCVCVCVCVCVKIYIYIYIYTHTHTYTYTHIHTYIHTHTHTHTCIYIHVHTHTHTHINKICSFMTTVYIPTCLFVT